MASMIRVSDSHFLLAGLLVLLSPILTYGQAGNFRSINSGPWSTSSTWERDADSNGSFEESPSTVSPNSSSGTIQIRSGHNVSLTADETIDDTTVDVGGTLTINGGVNLNFPTFSFLDVLIVDGTLNNNGNVNITDFDFVQVNGTVNNTGTFTDVFASGTENWLFFNSGSTYDHRFTTTAGAIPNATWDTGSTVRLSGYTSNTATPTGLNQVFGNFTIDLAALTSSLALGGQLFDINGNFTVVNTNNRPVYLKNGGTGFSLDIAGFFHQMSGNFFFSRDLTTATDITIHGLFDHDAGNLILTSGTNPGSLTVNLKGNLDRTGTGIWSATAAAGATIIFNGSSQQTLTSSIADGSTIISYRVAAGSDLLIPNGSFIRSTSGSSSLYVENTALLRVGSTDASGAIQTGTSAGNIRISGTRTYEVGSTIVYSGSVLQRIGNGHPTTAGVNITVGNTAGLQIIAPTTLAGTINLSSGNLDISNSSLTITGNITGSNRISIGATGSLTISGNSNIGTFPFTNGAQNFLNFTLNNTNGVTFGNDVSLSGTLTLTNGVLIYNNRTLTLDGTVSSAAGTISGNAASTLSIGGSGVFGQLPITPGNTIGTLIFNRTSGTANINSALTISSAFNLLNGDFTNTNGLQMANGSTLTRSSNGQLLGNPPTNLPAGQFYNVSYTGGSLTTGLELSNTSDDMLGSLTINTSSPVSLDKNIIVRGNVNLQSSTLQAVTNNITMAATPGTWNKTGGTFSGGTGSVIIAGNTTVSASSTPNFTNIATNSGSTLTLPSIQTNITGNIQLNAGSTFNANGGTIRLSGTGDQIITGAGKNFNNIAINKASGNVQLNPSVNLIGILDIQTATQLQSNGNLVLVSTSDAATGNASIASLPVGASITGNVVFQRFMSGEGRIYRDISSPVQNATPAQIQASGVTITGPFTGSSFPCAGCSTNGYSMYQYNESATGAISNGYVGFPVTVNTEQLTVGRGYNVLVRNEIGPATIQLTGPVNVANVTPITLPVTYTVSGGPAADGWNFVGNPFPCTVDWDIIAGWTKTNIQGNQIAIWDAGTNQYRYWNGSVGTHGSGRIASGQGFWVQTNNTSPALQINETAKTTTLGSFHRSGPLDYIEIAMAKGAIEDKAFIQKIEGATEAFDSHDGTKFQNATFSLSTLSSDGFALSINAMENFSCGGAIQVKTNYSSIPSEVNGFYSLSINSVGVYEGMEFSLHDNFLNQDVDLDGPYQYEVTSTVESRSASRFILTVEPKSANLELNLEGPSEICEGSAFIVIKDSEVGIEYNLQLNDGAITGQQLGTGGDLEFNVPVGALANSTNTIVARAFNQCNAVSLNATLTILKDDIYTPDAINGNSCKSGSVTIAASGAPDSGAYRWYENQSSSVSIAEGEQFVTPILDKSKTYFVSIVNALGCEGAKIPVVAEVNNFDDATIEVAGNTLTTNYSAGVQWFKDGVAIVGATNSSIAVEESGTYSVEVNIGACTTSASRELQITGIEDMMKYGSIVYPNPVVNVLNIQYPGKGTLKASIRDASGKMMEKQELLEHNGDRSGHFDMTSRSQGIYYLQLVDGNKVVLLKFFKK